MIRSMLAVFAALSFIATSHAEAQDYFQQFVHYTMRVRLDTKDKRITGSETIRYKNNSPDTLRHFYLHLYPNAFKNKNTAYMKDIRRAFNYSLFDVPKKYRSDLNISDVKIDGRAVEPEIDDTIAKMTLPAPLPPGGSIEVALRFDGKIRRHLGRAGYRGKHYDFAQWYPKVVVYDENGWHPDKFRTGEFYGEFGTYDVYLEVPDNYVVAATGVVRDGDPGWTYNRKGASKPSGKGYKTVHFHAEDVHDFAWNADPDFIVEESTWNDIEVRSFYRKSQKAWADTTLAHGLRAMEWLSERVGPYPYPQVSIVDALLRGGMEYPMLVMDGRVSEGLVLHEVGHIYFYGILANDERAEAWLDEGFATFQTDWYMMERYGPYGNRREWKLYDRLTPQYTRQENQRRRIFPLMRLGYGERVGSRAEEFQHAYYPMVYRKAALILFALRYVVGEETFDKILKEYYTRWQLKHVNEERFRAVCEEVSGMDLGWFFDQWLHSTKICDYELAEVKTRPSASGGSYTSEVRIKRRGEIVMPLTVEFTFADGTVQRARLEGRLRTIDEDFDFPEKPKRIAVNPDNEIIDINLSDNFLPRRRSLQFDWPGNDYYPEDAYQIRYNPMVWYNDVDGWRPWLHMESSYVNWSRRMELAVYYGVDSDRLDFSASYIDPRRILDRNGELEISGYKREGRQDLTLEARFRSRKELLRPPTQEAGFGFNYHELTDTRYVDPETYQTGSDLGPYFAYRIDPQLDIGSTLLDFGLRFGREWFGGEYKYTSFYSDLTFKSRPLVVPFDADWRVFLGVVSGSMPFQRKFYLSGGGPLEREKLFFLRAPGAIPDDLNYHVGGHGNLRGYFTGDFGVNQLLATNFHLGTSIPFLSRNPKSLFGEIKWMGFADVGWIFDTENPIGTSARVQGLVDAGVLDKTLVDAGIGFTLHRTFPFWDMFLRLDLPFYVNNPEVNGETDEVEHRYVFSFTAAF